MCGGQAGAGGALRGLPLAPDQGQVDQRRGGPAPAADRQRRGRDLVEGQDGLEMSVRPRVLALAGLAPLDLQTMEAGSDPQLQSSGLQRHEADHYPRQEVPLRLGAEDGS